MRVSVNAYMEKDDDGYSGSVDMSRLSLGHNREVQLTALGAYDEGA